MIDRRVQTPVARIELHVHHPPALELDSARLPAFTGRAAIENEAALACAYHYHYFSAHNHLDFLVKQSCVTEFMF